MRHDGHGIARLFFFQGWDLGRLDAAVASAARNNVYLAITLADGNADCGEVAKTTAWFEDASARASYIAHMSMLLTRYKGNHAIAWFEYFNEPTYADGRLRSFYDDMGDVARRIDPTRLFSSGTIAPYSLGGSANFLDVSRSAGVSITSLHEYDFEESESHQGPPTRANSAGKPTIVGEFGVIDPTMSAGDCRAVTDRLVQRVRRKVESYLNTPDYAAVMAWAWQPDSAPAGCPQAAINTDETVQDIFRVAAPAVSR
jgi:hypothetical protein